MQPAHTGIESTLHAPKVDADDDPAAQEERAEKEEALVALVELASWI